MSPNYNRLITYLITFTCYGCHLHGSEAGSVDRNHRIPGTPIVEANDRWALGAYARMAQGAYTLDPVRRDVVLKAIQGVCAYRHWYLLAAHVRTTHVHIVVSAEAEPERVMTDFKTYASRALNVAGFDTANRNRWTRHGSTRYLWNAEDVAGAIHYVIHDQGAPMSLFEDTAP